MASPDSSFHSIENLPAPQQVLFNRFSRGKPVKIPYNLVHHAFEAVADQHPQITAVRHYDGTTITYQELEQRANILANQLCRTYRIRKGDRVVLVYSRCIEMVVFILAVLKAGAQYIPLDGGVTPVETLGYVIADSEARIVLCLPRFRAKVEESIPVNAKANVTVVDLDAENVLWKIGDRRRVSIDMGPEDGAYVIYTSGTTGRPKGVDVSHGGVTNNLLVEPSKLEIAAGKNVIQQLNVGFDMCAWEILGTMMNGGTLHIRGSGNDSWAECLRRVDTVIATPSVVSKHMPQQQDFPNIRTIVVGGEPCPYPLAEHWAPHVKLWNICGPTEITILNSAHLHKPGGVLSIGKPTPNNNIYILDDEENPVAIGESGIMWAGGLGVSRGYFNLPELTSARYKPDKFTLDGRKMFNTGDLARWLEDGSLEPLGRKDDQVKISGFRVELDGVSRSIERCPTVVKACALKIDEALWGFYSAPQEISQDTLKEFVGIGQPFYAVPSIWKYLQTIELTPNGKVDKTILRQLAAPPPSQASESSSNLSIVPFSPISDISTVSSDLENAAIDWEDTKEVEKYTLPAKKGFHGWRWIRHRGMSAYRKLFTLIFVANLIPFAVMLWKSRRNNFLLPLPSLVTAVSANLLGAVLIRQDEFVNLIYWLASRPPVSTPFFIRRHLARIYHNGGVHSGCAVSAFVWWIIFTSSATRYRMLNANPNPVYPYHIDTATITLTYLILALLYAIVLMAYPTIRAKFHDYFELTHRFAGWTALGLVWAHLFVTTASISQGPLGTALAKTPGLYLLTGITICIASPWVRLRRVKVVPEKLSRHAVRLHFDFFTPRTSSSVALRISDRPLVEWHAFAGVFAPGTTGFSVVVSRAGDWTGRIIDNPPTSLWTRGVPASGVLAIAPLFKKMVLVATGSGIGPCMPVIMDNVVPIRIIWSTKNPEKTYGKELLDIIYKRDPNVVIWNTDQQGRPDLAALAYQVYRESDAEVVCIISNASTTAKFVYQMESRGIPAVAPVFDS